MDRDRNAGQKGPHVISCHKSAGRATIKWTGRGTGRGTGEQSGERSGLTSSLTADRDRYNLSPQQIEAAIMA